MKTADISTQEHLSFGYLYLLILGIISDTIYYSFLGINILNYSTILDILISPVAILTSNYIVPLIILTSISFVYFVFSTAPSFHKKYREKKWYQKWNDVEKLDEKYTNYTAFDMVIIFSAFLILIFYVGLGIGKGIGFSQKIKNKEFNPDHQIVFDSNEELIVKIWGQNGMYMFYGDSSMQLTIAPIENNITKIRKLEN